VRVDGRIATKQKFDFGGNAAAQEKIVMNADKARERAERHFRREERAQDVEKR